LSYKNGYSFDKIASKFHASRENILKGLREHLKN
jgi:hypothetical protein